MEFLLKHFLGIPFYCFKLCVCVHVCLWVCVCIVPVETRGIRHCGAEVTIKCVYVHVCMWVYVCVCAVPVQTRGIGRHGAEVTSECKACVGAES